MIKAAAKGKRAAKKRAASRKAAVPRHTPQPVVIPRPTSAEETRRAFGIGARRWKHIQELVDEVVG
jgi:hypothetical protein